MNVAIHLDKLLRELKRSLLSNKEELIAALSEETQRSQVECFTTEFIPTLSSIQWLRDNGPLLYQNVSISTGLPFYFGSRKAILKRVPLGNVLIIGTWNYPLQIHFRQILFALYSGNSVFFKPSPYSPKSSAIIANIFQGVPQWKSKVTVLDADPNSLDAIWGKTNCVVFTGSTQTGKIIAAKAAENFIPAIIEASGFDSVVLGKKELHPRSLQHIMWGVTTHNGETCVAPKIIWYPKSESDRIKKIFSSLFNEFISERKTTTRKFTTPNTHRVISTFKELSNKHKVEIVVDDDQGMILLHIPDKERLHLLVKDAVQNNVLPFAPVLLIVPYSQLEKIGEWTRSDCGGLMLSTFGLDRTERKLIENCVVTSVISHEETVVAAGAPGVSFGGSRGNGIGRTGGMEFLDQLTKTQTIITAGLTARMTLPTSGVFNGKDNTASKFLQWLFKRYKK